MLGSASIVRHKCAAAVITCRRNNFDALDVRTPGILQGSHLTTRLKM